MERIGNAIVRHFVPRLLQRACPDIIPRSGEDGAQMNCFYVAVQTGNRPDYFAVSVDADTVHVVRPDASTGQYNVPDQVPLKSIRPETLIVTHYYGLETIRYEGAFRLALGRLTGWRYAGVHARRLSDRIAQRLFNRRSLVLRNRLDALRDVALIAAATGADANALDVLTHRWGYRWADHPDWQSHQDALDSQLCLLAEAGELREVNGKYRPTGTTLKVLEEAEDQDRKHNSTLRIQWLLFIIAVVAAIAAAAQAEIIKLPTLVDLRKAEQRRKDAVEKDSEKSCDQGLRAGRSSLVVAFVSSWSGPGDTRDR